MLAADGRRGQTNSKSRSMLLRISVLFSNQVPRSLTAGRRDVTFSAPKVRLNLATLSFMIRGGDAISTYRTIRNVGHRLAILSEDN